MAAPTAARCTDPNVAYLIKPELYSDRAKCNVEIERLELTIGETVVDWWK